MPRKARRSMPTAPRFESSRHKSWKDHRREIDVQAKREEIVADRTTNAEYLTTCAAQSSG